jgi:peptidoglycan/xylan/chitin deacetylase (PgdA/CDA1 family)
MKIWFLILFLVSLSSNVVTTGENIVPVTTDVNYVLDTFDGNIEEKDIAIQVVDNGSAVSLRDWGIFCCKFPHPESFWEGEELFCYDTYQYLVEAFVEDESREFETVQVSGTSGSTLLAFNIYGDHPNEWWSNPNIFVGTEENPPHFPQHYTMTIVTFSGQTASLSKTVTVWEWAVGCWPLCDGGELCFSDEDGDENGEPWEGSFRTKEHDFGQKVMLKALTVEAYMEEDERIEVTMYGKDSNDSDWKKLGTYVLTSESTTFIFDKKPLVKKVKYGLTGTEGIKLVGRESGPLLDSITLEAKPLEFMVTFDDGPVSGKTDKIISALKDAKITRDSEGIIVKREPVKAAFFMVGDNDLKYHAWFEFWRDKGSVKKNHLLVQKVAGANHIIGNHTQHHAYFSDQQLCWPPFGPPIPYPCPDWWKDFGYETMEAFVKDEINDANDEIRNALPPTMISRGYSEYLILLNINLQIFCKELKASL